MTQTPAEAAPGGPTRESASPASRRRRGRSAARDRLEYALFTAAAGWLARRGPETASRVGARLARLYVSLAPSRRRILEANLASAFPDLAPAQIRALARRSVENFGSVFLEFLDSSRYSREQIEDRVVVVGREHLDAARARGKGVFVLSAHFGSWELGAVRAGLLGEPIASVARPLDNALLEAEVAGRRTRFGNSLIRKNEAAREILRALRERRTVAIMIDQNVLPGEGVFVPFFGRLAATSPSLALLQMKTDAAIVPAFAWPLGSGRYRLEFEAPVLAAEFEGGQTREERVRLATARYMAITEAAVRRAPEAWLWIHNRWRTRPPDES